MPVAQRIFSGTVASTTWTPNARTVDVRPRSGRHVQCRPVRKTAGWKATDIAGYRSGGARLHYRLIGVIWRFADKSAKWMRKRCGVRADLYGSSTSASDFPRVRVALLAFASPYPGGNLMASLVSPARCVRTH